MGWYIEFDDVANRYPNVAEKVGAGMGEIEGFIQGAEAQIDASLASKYPTPFTPGSSNAPYLIRDICIDLTYWKARGWQSKELGPTLKKYIDERLASIVNGSVLLTNSAGLVAQGPTFAAATSDDTRSSFGVDDPINWTVSSNWQDDFQSAREAE